MSTVTATKTCLKFFFNTKNIVGLGSDNASVTVEINNGVYKMLKEDNLNLILIICVFHSLQLATSYACAYTIPRHLDFLIL